MGKNYSKKYVLLFALLMLSVMAFAQTGSISGKVVDEKNQPLPGATVTINGTTNGAAADANGNYVIRNVKAGTYTLTAKFIGYDVLTKSVTVSGATSADFSLLPSTKSLNEVVVIGYGTQTRKEVTGAISTVSSKDFQKGTITSPEQLIQGKIAGVSITTNGGQPGSGSVIRIRQGASLNASSDPLIVIDGVPLSPNGISGAGNALSLINPDDIETYTVLKDAASTAIYGSRASNGVIIITTKKGKSGAPAVNVSSQNSVATTANRLDVLSADQVRQYVNANGTAAQKALLGKASTNWQDEIYQKAFTTNNNVSISGSAKNMPYRVSVGNLDQDGILKTDHINRTTTAIRLSPKFFNEDLKFDLNLNGTYQKSQFANTGAIGAAASFDPTQAVYAAGSKYNGYYEWLNADGTLNPNAPRNPVGMLNDYHNTGNTYRSFGNLQTDYRFRFLPQLHANLNLGYDLSKGGGSVFVPANAAQSFNNGNSTNSFNTGGANTEYHQKNYNTVGEFYLNYNNTFKSINSNINATAGYGYYDFRTVTRNYANYTASGALVANSAPLYPYGEGRYTIESYYARLIYTYDSKYILAGSIRRDGSSKFAPNLRNATFPSVAFTWRMSDEDFLKNSKDLSDLKLRLSYGITGQQDGIGYYGYIPSYYLSDNTSKYQLGNSFYNMYTPSAYDTSLRWEQTSSYNAGLDYGFFDQRLSGAIDVYYKKTKNLLGTVYLPVGANFTNLLTTNVGNTETKGIEFSLNAIPVKTKDFSWTLNYNVAYNKNTITNLSAIKGLVVTVPTGGISGATGTNVELQSVGSTPNSFYVYKQVYGANGKPLEGVYADLNGDGVINDQDRYLYKSPFPKVTMGFSTQFDYKKWSLNAVLRANLGNYAYNNTASNLGVARNIITVQNTINNASTDYYNTLFSNNQYLSDYYVQNASFLRMDNLGLGYNFGRIAKHVNLRLNANVQNVFVVTKYKGIDPEIFSGIDNSFYPRPRTYTIGFNLGL
ncbi:SusC/RagA family TonB-linked outer membrane protein [Mucilaginibacter sp. KACC 22063]|uniref:SusC/RagA family TonB-linked outer membrane protein n=1 Tax=Mucilaginibacter sp. KACC 22063 TaxID=3025666 RepID=UPI0023671CFC|nr:SusC/RagA family TonB-linked outer membrane protein [Mucilaginibacter sp. KACC 22063]WDF54069.1 SusC/RagA family TonB-linked outer membrane protein [Mucilaginibacter sp. KACC 22063]